MTTSAPGKSPHPPRHPPTLSASRVRPLRRGKQSGLATVELALILPILISLLAFPMFIGKVFMHYSVMQKAAQNTAVYFASIPTVEMADGRWAEAADELAEELVETMTGELVPGGTGVVGVEIYCDGESCGPGNPEAVRVVVKTVVKDDLFSRYTKVIGGFKGITLRADFTVPYAGS